MKLLIHNILWVNPEDPLTENLLSIRIENGAVSEFGPGLLPGSEEEVVDGEGWSCSPGWVDLKVTLGEPGKPQNEGLESLCLAAAAGGFTEILVQPDTKLIIQSRESVHFFKSYTPENGVKFWVAAAATLDLKGEKMAEVLTLNHYGADAFASVYPIANAGFFSRLLQYLTHSDKVLIHNPVDETLYSNGQMHDGEVSDRRGLSGIPSVAEELMVRRDLAIQEFSEGKLHLSSISSKGSVEIIAEAKARGHVISCDVAAHQLAFTHEELDQFDTLYKVFPPYRLETDRQALIKGLHEGTIDAVVSDHRPWHYDFKDIEFESAEFGISSLETTFSTLCTFGEGLSQSQIVQLLSINPRKILGKDLPVLQVGMPARFTVFNIEKDWKVDRSNWQSKSANNPFIGKEMKGMVLGVVTDKGFQINPHSLSTK